MAERTVRSREPDAGSSLGRGDANIPDFLAQQQGAEDLHDFALQTKAGVTAQGGILADAEAQPPTPPVAEGDDVSGWVLTDPTGGTVSVDTATAGPVNGVTASLKVAPNGTTVASPIVLTSPKFDIPTTDFIRIYGWFMHHRLTRDATVFIDVYFYDENDVQVFRWDGYGLDPGRPQIINTTNTDTWLPIDRYVQLPVGAKRYVVQVTLFGIGGDIVNFASLWLNNFQVRPASQFEGAHLGVLTPRAAWRLPWGLMPGGYVSVSGAQVGIGAGSTTISSLSISPLLVNGRNYRIVIRLYGANFSTTNNGWQVIIQKDAANHSRPMSIGNVNAVANTDLVTGNAIERNPTSGFHTFTAVLSRFGGAGSFDLGGTGSLVSEMWIEDIGPYGEPPDGVL